MAVDTLKQTGKSLKETKTDTNYSLKRVSKNFPLVEKLRDSFDTTRPFIIEFKTYGSNDDVKLTLIFTEAFEHTC